MSGLKKLFAAGYITGIYKRMTRLHALTGNGLFLAGDYMIYPTSKDTAESSLLAAEEAIEWLED